MNSLPHQMQLFQIAMDTTVFSSGIYVLKCNNDDICIDLDMVCSVHLSIVL